jgi:molybdopterin/thiamine biosynthesis adenylyltransferase
MTGDRYSRQAAAGFDQGKLSNAEVVIVGCGALGNGVASILAIEGVGHLYLVDSDKIELHNVTRQFMFTEGDVGEYKADVLARRLKERNSGIKIKVHREWISDEKMTLDAFVSMYLTKEAVLVGCVDNNPARAYLNQFAVAHHYSLVSGGTQGMHGWYSAYVPHQTRCLDCTKGIYELAARRRERAPCNEQPNPAVAETSLLVSTGMANLVRKIVAPIDEDDDIPNGITQIDLYQNAIAHTKVPRKAKCKC